MRPYIDLNQITFHDFSDLQSKPRSNNNCDIFAKLVANEDSSSRVMRAKQSSKMLKSKYMSQASNRGFKERVLKEVEIERMMAFLKGQQKPIVSASHSALRTPVALDYDNYIKMNIADSDDAKQFQRPHTSTLKCDKKLPSLIINSDNIYSSKTENCIDHETKDNIIFDTGNIGFTEDVDVRDLLFNSLRKQYIPRKPKILTTYKPIIKEGIFKKYATTDVIKHSRKESLKESSIKAIKIKPWQNEHKPINKVLQAIDDHNECIESNRHSRRADLKFIEKALVSAAASPKICIRKCFNRFSSTPRVVPINDVFKTYNIKVGQLRKPYL